jgi:hypothetical protein
VRGGKLPLFLALVSGFEEFLVYKRKVEAAARRSLLLQQGDGKAGEQEEQVVESKYSMIESKGHEGLLHIACWMGHQAVATVSLWSQGRDDTWESSPSFVCRS